MRNPDRGFLCKACGAGLEVTVNFKGKIVWKIDPENPDFGSEQPTLRGESSHIRVVCTADVMHACGYTCLEGILVEAEKQK
jgi:hypothetical protein